MIHAGCRKQRTYWANSSCERLCDAIENLREREGKKCLKQDIHFVDQGGSSHAGNSKSVSVVRKWLLKMKNLDAAIWTGLPGTYDRGSAIKYLKSVKDPARLARAREYVRMTPPQIQTEVRAAMRKEGWSDCDLPPELFARNA